jgi:hypothetical protein
MNETPDDPVVVPAVLAYSRRPEARSPRAAWFPETVKATILERAQRYGLTTVDIAPEQVDLVKAAVPEGEITAAGKVDLASIKKDIFERLLANLAGAPVEKLDGSGTLPPGVMPAYLGSSDDIQPQDVSVDPLWAALTVNMVVLAPEYGDRGATDGWWEAIIVAMPRAIPASTTSKSPVSAALVSPYAMRWGAFSL